MTAENDNSHSGIKQTPGSGDLDGRALEALREHHPRKWDLYERCVVRGQRQKEAAAELGISIGRVSQHLTDAKLIVAASHAGIWDPGKGLFSFAETARRLDMTERDLRRQLADFATKDLECAYCHELYKPKTTHGSSPYCSERHRHAAAKHSQGKVCAHEECKGLITDAATYCMTHRQFRPIQCQGQDCGALITPTGTKQRFCHDCKKENTRQRRRQWRKDHKGDVVHIPAIDRARVPDTRDYPDLAYGKWLEDTADAQGLTRRKFSVACGFAPVTIERMIEKEANARIPIRPAMQTILSRVSGASISELERLGLSADKFVEQQRSNTLAATAAPARRRATKARTRSMQKWLDLIEPERLRLGWSRVELVCGAK